MPAPEAEHQDAADALPPAAVSQYLAATGDWVLEARQAGVREIWSLPASLPVPAKNQGEARPRGRIMLPLATDFIGFGQHFRDALTALATINHWTPLELEREILATRADLFLIRLVQDDGSQSLPLRQAEITIEAIYKMLRAAAMTTATPHQRFRGGRLPVPVSAFLDDDVQLGHTQRGSFVFTIITRLGGPAAPGSARRASWQPRPFSRRTMETLALGIETARDLAEGRTAAVPADPSEWGLSSSLIESLEDITQPSGLRSVDLSFEWAAAESRPAVGSEPVRFRRDHLEDLQRLREHLLQAEEPSRRETLIGTVVSLSREEDEASGSEAASVVISAEVSGRRRNVHLTLAGRHHDLAIQAYRMKVPVVVTGDLAFTRRAWQLEGTIEIDEDILRRQIADAGREET